MFNVPWSRLRDLNPGPTHYERHGKAASLIEVVPLQAISVMEFRDSLRGAGLSAGHQQGLENSSTGSSWGAILTAFGATSQSRVSGFPSIIVQ